MSASIWATGPLPAGVRVGENVLFERHATSLRRFRSERDPGLEIGSGCRIHTWTEFSIEPDGHVVVGERTVLVGALIMCNELVEIGRDVVVSYDVTIADCDFHPHAAGPRRADAIAISPDRDLADRQPIFSEPVVIEDGAWIGIGAIVLKGVRIGANARVAAGSVVTRNVSAGAEVAGNPAREVAE